MMTCECLPGCENVAVRRACGHIACDACTDAESETCIYCVPVDEAEYHEAVRRVQASYVEVD
jgi:hypothetical protein